MPPLRFLTGTRLSLSCDWSPEKNEAMTDAFIRQRVEDWAKAVRARDIETVLSLYATNNVSFDLDPPLRYTGDDNKREAWKKFFAARTGPIGYDVRKLNVTANGDLAFVHSLNHANEESSKSFRTRVRYRSFDRP